MLLLPCLIRKGEKEYVRERKLIVHEVKIIGSATWASEEKQSAGG